MTLPSGETAGCRHAQHLQRAYEELGLAHHALYAWAQEHGHDIRGDVLEIYVNDPMVVAADELLTEVVMPIA